MEMMFDSKQSELPLMVEGDLDEQVDVYEDEDADSLFDETPDWDELEKVSLEEEEERPRITKAENVCIIALMVGAVVASVVAVAWVLIH